MIHRWKLKKDVVRLIPRATAKISVPTIHDEWLGEAAVWSWGTVIAEKDDMYLCSYSCYKRWFKKKDVRIITGDNYEI